MQYFGIMPERKLWIKIAAIFIGIYGVYSAAVNSSWFYLPFGIIVILAAFSNRRHVISSKGVDICYTVFNVPIHNMWTWGDVTSIHTDLIKLKPNVEMHIGRGVSARRFVFTETDTYEILEMARRMSSDIYISEVNHK